MGFKCPNTVLLCKDLGINIHSHSTRNLMLLNTKLNVIVTKHNVVFIRLLRKCMKGSLSFTKLHPSLYASL